VTYTIEELKTWLMLEERYGLYGHFKANILLPAIEDINKNTDITVEVEKEFKEGRRVVKIKFVVKGGKRKGGIGAVG
jgi:plasmid replication initiation protein